jgi:4-hydroxy-4-methyl-2-oxoglutarate aldolase
VREVAKAALDATRADLLERLDRLNTSIVSDSLDQLGYREQVMAPRIRPLFPEARLVGCASTVLAVPVSLELAPSEDDYSLYLSAIESLGPGDVMIVSTIENCFWGELVSRAALSRGARGVVIDGFTRDGRSITSMGFPTFVAGVHVADVLGRVEVAHLAGEIEAGGVVVKQGDLVIADYDGVVVMPIGIAEEAIGLAENILRSEDKIRASLEQGITVSVAFREGLP